MDIEPKKELTVFDSTCLIVGIIIGAGIYQTAPDVARAAQGAGGMFLLWIAGGVLSLFGALGYAELASAYPQEGGDYVYLTRAYGPAAGFLFGWIQMTVVRPGDIAAMAFA
ncbi:MAG: amino acid permease, partial [Sedimentisphaerales bacterium]|nr:amino acid permease [Sedimentisphaerales bacterium]